MSSSAIELVDLIARWIHVIAAIMWAGNSMLFNWLDRNLRPGSRDAAGGNAPGALGQIWLLHSGAFYYVEKTLLGGQPMPKPLHWFKWQAYTTWWSGMALLIAVYWFGGRALLENGSGGPGSHAHAVWIAAGSILLGWALYEGMQRFVAPRLPLAANVIWIVGLAAISLTLLHYLNGRAAFLHVGAMLGTIMAANVFFTIVPSQRELVASVNEGRGADPAVSARAKRVSIHNNYFTFPVIVLMVSNHFPAMYAGRFNWLLLLTLIAAGAAVRHVLNLRFTVPSWQPILAATITASAIALLTIMRVGAEAPSVVAPALTAPVTFAEVRHVIDRRCASCHSSQPSDLSFGAAPGGVMFDTPEQIRAHAERIHARAVLTRTMPPANKTHITELERAIIARWVAGGAGLK